MDRAQIHTLEAAIAALLIVGALLFASQATAVTPLSASTSNQHIENQMQNMGEDVLAIAHRDGSLGEALTYWNQSDPVRDQPAHFREADPNQTVYASLAGTDHPLGPTLDDAFQLGVHAYNIELRYVGPDGELNTVDKVRMGTPSDNAVTASRTVTLFDDDTIEDGDVELADLDENEFWAENVDDDSPVYAVVEVRLTVWRM